MAAGSRDRSLQETPTWAVALVCTVFVIISIFIEHGIQSLGKLFKKRNKKAMTEALEKIKAELMLLGFISLLLSVGITYVVKICIPIKLGDKLLPCEDQKKGGYDDDGDKRGGGGDDKRKLLSYAEEIIWRRALAAGDEKEDHCAAQLIMLWNLWLDGLLEVRTRDPQFISLLMKDWSYLLLELLVELTVLNSWMVHGQFLSGHCVKRRSLIQNLTLERYFVDACNKIHNSI